MKNQKIRVGVTGVGSLLGQGIVRSLKMSNLNHTSIGLCLDKYSTGLYWTDEYSYIKPAKDPYYIENIISTINEKNVDILLIGTDVELPYISKNKTLIESRTNAKILISDEKLVSIANDKYLTSIFFKDNGLPFPKSFISGSEETLDEYLEKTNFPLIVKPRDGARSKGVSVVKNISELNYALSTTTNPVVQEYLGDADAEYTASAIYFDGKCRASIIMRRHLRDGNTYRAFVEKNNELSDWITKWCDATKPFGPINFQFRCDVRGIPKVFEINSRFSGTTPLRALCGFNEVELCINFIANKIEVSQPAIKDITILRHWEETVIYNDSLLP
jgi:carbamoyl-phosphate synthase large subunit